jgi:branched-chain amino acid transport system ATP-binding protein
MAAVLDVQGLTMDFGGLRAVNQVDIDVNEHEIAALIGPNGAGKTTFFNCVTGVYKPTGGDIYVSPPGGERERLNGLKPNRITERGLARTFQNIRLFQNMTVLENIMIARDVRMKAGIYGAVTRNRTTREEEERLVHESYQVLTEIGLEQFVNDLAKNLPYGAQRRLEIARALGTDPFILLLDEPAAGMNPLETQRLVDLILQIRDTRKITILLIEHDMSLVMRLSERIFVMDYGKLIAVGEPNEIKSDPVVITAYLGEEADA